MALFSFCLLPFQPPSFSNHLHSSRSRHDHAQVQILCYAFGGKDQYLGKSIAEAHAHLITARGINRSHFRRVVALLTAALVRIDVPQALVDECIANLAPAASVFPEVGEPALVGPDPAPEIGTAAALARARASSPGEAA